MRPDALAALRRLDADADFGAGRGRDRDFALQIYRDLHIPATEELSTLFAEWAATGQAEIDDPEAAAKLLLSIVIGDSMLHTLAGLENEWLDNEELDWRLQPFLSHFRII